MPDIDYYSNQELWGNYQYVTLEQIINDFMATSEDDDYTANTSRRNVLYHAQRVLRELYYDVLYEVKAIELEIGQNLFVVLPPDFVNYVRISWVDDNGRLHPMAENRKMSLAVSYLQDNTYDLLFDGDGNVMKANGVRNKIPPLNFIQQPDNTNYYQFHHPGFTPNRDLSKVYINGSYRLDKDRGIIEFSSEVYTRNIVLEYISDGLYRNQFEEKIRTEADLRVHKFAEQAMLDGIYYNSIKTKRNVPANEKERARRAFWASVSVAKRRIDTLRHNEILQTNRKSSTWVKGLSPE